MPTAARSTPASPATALSSTSDNLLKKVHWEAMPPVDLPLIVAVSGGCDSIVLLHLLRQQGFRNLTVCHVDHSLRKDSGEDANSVKKLAKDLGLRAFVKKVDVPARITEEKLSLETAARLCRHDVFADCAATHGIKHIVLAHHADDQAETILFNLLRGSHGLRGMQQTTQIGELTFLRPLLDIPRQELREYAATHSLPFREDPTNAQPIAARNRLRNEALPLLSEILGRDVASAINRAEAAQASLQNLDISLWLDPQGRLHLPTFRQLPEPFQKAVLHRFLQLACVPTLSEKLITRALAIIDPTSPARLSLPGGHTLYRREARLFMSRD